MGDQFDAIKEDFENLLHFKKEGESGSTTRLRSTINIGGELPFAGKTSLQCRLIVEHSSLYSPKAYTELTLSGNYRPVKWFEATLSYSFIHSKFEDVWYRLELITVFGSISLLDRIIC